MSEFKIQYGEIYSWFSGSAEPAEPTFKIQYGEIYSNRQIFRLLPVSNLKSSMERFIVSSAPVSSVIVSPFKIQYGEIYSVLISSDVAPHLLFKIQYGEIYRG